MSMSSRKRNLIKKILLELIDKVLDFITDEMMKAFADKVLDFVEEYVVGTSAVWDDAIFLPLCARIRATFDIPDNDGE